jgi:endonuclease YncB( thermonuclease family)
MPRAFHCSHANESERRSHANEGGNGNARPNENSKVRTLVRLGALLFLSLLPACHVAHARPRLAAEVVRVVDGDTLEVDTRASARVRVRLLGIDCPESHPNEKCVRQGLQGGDGCAAQVPRGRAATRRAKDLVAGRRVTLEPDGFEQYDRYGRLLAYVRLENGADLGLELLREGFCADYSATFPHPRASTYRQATRK